MDETQRTSPESGVAWRDDAELARRAIVEQAAELDALRQHALAAARAVNDARSQAEDARRALQQACVERAHAWEENERLRIELGTLRAELDRFHASRFHRLLVAYRRLYELPVLGPVLRLLRRIIGGVLRRIR